MTDNHENQEPVPPNAELEPMAVADVDWDRWDELKAQRDLRELSQAELEEYEVFVGYVAHFDAEENRRVVESLATLNHRHQEVLRSIERFTEAIESVSARK